MDQKIYTNTIVPLKSNAYLATFAITTPTGDLGWFSFLQDIKGPDGQYVFKTYYKGTACQACIRKGRPQDCEHKTMPPWKSESGIAAVAAILEKDVAAFNKEIQGITTVDQARIFAAYIPGFLQMDLYEFRNPVSLTFTFIDPAGYTLVCTHTHSVVFRWRYIRLCHYNDRE